MNVLDDSDEDIFDATSRPAASCNSIDTLIECTEDETSCEVLQFPSSDEAHSVDKTLFELFNSEYHQTAVQSTNPADSDCGCDVTVPTPLPSGDCKFAMDVDSSASSSVHCDMTTGGATVRTVCCLTDTDAPDVIGSCQFAELRTVSISSNEPEDELLAELESEFSCTPSVRSDCVSLDCDNANGPVGSPVDRLSNDDLTSAYASLQRRQQAIECRLQNTLEAKRELETENARLECKLTASLEALETARSQVGSSLMHNFAVCCLATELCN